MRDETDSRKWAGSRRIVAVSGVICASLLAALGIVCLSVVVATNGKPIGWISADRTSHEGPVIDHELWYVVDSYEQSSIFAKVHLASSRLKRLNLETGMDSETGLVLPGDEATSYPIRLDDDVILLAAKSIYQVSGNSLVRLGPRISWDANLMVYPFRLDGKLTVVRKSDDGTVRLSHLIDGQWIDGRQVVLPGPGRVWQNDPQRNHITLLPLSCEQPWHKRSRNLSILQVVNFNSQPLLVFSDIDQFGAYRVGFEYTDEPPNEADALAPENASREVSGWKPINGPDSSERWLGVTVDQLGLIFQEFGRSQSLIRLTANGRWEALTEHYQRRRLESPNVVSGSSNDPLYVVYWNDLMNSAKICRVEGNDVQAPHIVLTESYKQYLFRWGKLTIGLAFVWLIHASILFAGFAWIVRSNGTAVYEFAHRRVRLASMGRRAVATGIDVTLVATIVIVTGWMLSIDNLVGRYDYVETLTQMLMETENDLIRRFEVLSLGEWRHAFRMISPDEQLRRIMSEFLQNAFPLLALLAVLGIVKVFMEARYGTSPGKWLVGIRVIRSTGRPCGFTRSLVRMFLFCVDFPFGLTPTPAFVSMLCSNRWQRLGDRVADTIVIRNLDCD